LEYFKGTITSFTSFANMILGKDLLILLVLICVSWVNALPLPCTITFLPASDRFDFTDATGNTVNTSTNPLPRTCGGNPYTLGIVCTGFISEISFLISVSTAAGLTIGSFLCTSPRGLGCCTAAGGDHYSGTPLPSLPSTTVLTVTTGAFQQSFITGDPHLWVYLGNILICKGLTTKYIIYSVILIYQLMDFFHNLKTEKLILSRSCLLCLNLTL